MVHRGHAAREKTLGIYELLANIISHMDAPNIHIAKRVCKHWFDIIEKSRDIQNAMVCRPFSFRIANRECDSQLLYGELPDCISSPEYDTSKFPIKLHPALLESPAKAADESWHWFTSRSIEEARFDQLATFPPCTAMGILSWGVRVVAGTEAYGYIYCVAYRRGGVRLRDLVEVNAKIIPQWVMEHKGGRGYACIGLRRVDAASPNGLPGLSCISKRFAVLAWLWRFARSEFKCCAA